MWMQKRRKHSFFYILRCNNGMKQSHITGRPHHELVAVAKSTGEVCSLHILLSSKGGREFFGKLGLGMSAAITSYVCT